MPESILGARALTMPTPDERRVIEAIKEVLLPMLQSEPQAVSYGAVAKAAIAAMADVPRVPNHHGPRTIDGADMLGDAVGLSIGVDARDEDGEPVVLLAAQVEHRDRVTPAAGMTLGPAQARPFFLAGLAACDAAEGPRAAELPPLREEDCDTTAAPVTLTSTAAERAAIEAHPGATEEEDVK